MPKNLKAVKAQGGTKKFKVPSKFRIGNRKSSKVAHGMSTDALKEALNNTNHKKDKNKIVTVLRSRGVEIDWPRKLVADNVSNDLLTDSA